MRYVVQVDGEQLDVELIERNGSVFALHPDLAGGAEVPVALTPVRSSGSYSLLVGERSLPVVAAGPNDELTLIIGSETWHCSVYDDREVLALAAESGGAGRAGGGTIRSVMPGIVREVRCGVGDTVEKGTALLILEAMKMENEIRADADGTVTAIHAEPGTAVAKGDALVTID